MQQTMPIKRSKELISLSREHHDGLLLCWKMRTGLSKQIAEKRIAEYVLHFYKTNLSSHFRKEENYLFILLPDTDSLRKQAEEQHRTLEKYIHDLKESNSKNTLNKFAELLEQHIRFEERTLFPYIEQQTEAQKLQDAEIKINTENNRCEINWNDQFWLK